MPIMLFKTASFVFKFYDINFDGKFFLIYSFITLNNVYKLFELYLNTNYSNSNL